jgi:signal transduction histidine kinase
MRTLFIRAIGVCLLASISPVMCEAQNVFSFSQGQSEFIKNIEILKDSSGNFKIDEAIKSDGFQLHTGGIPNLGVSSNTYWLRMQITNQSPHSDLVFEISYPILDLVEYFVVVNNVVTYSAKSGDKIPFSQRINDNKNYVFPLKLDSGNTVTCYFKVQCGEQLIFPINIGTDQMMYERQLNSNIFNGIYFGIVIVMLLYNMFLYLGIRDRSYGYYVLYIFFVGITQAILNGYAYKYLWPENTWLAVQSTSISGALSGLTTIFFVRSFLQTNVYSPRFNQLLTLFAVVYALSIIVCLAGQLQLSYQLNNINAGPGSLILLLTAVNIYVKHKTRPALFFIFAWSIFLVSVIVFVAKDLGLFPYNSLTVSGLQLGSAVVVTLLSVALADKINSYRKEKEQSQAQALAAAMENERIISEQNTILEERVNQRTIELKETNDELHETLRHLKETQSQLVDQEKMASLGQLTAGIAHEINNPINFVTSNIKPLKRDVELLIDLMNKIEQLSIEGLDGDKRKELIEHLKQEYDFNYLLEEIGFLLKGINEGSVRTAEIVKGLRLFSRVDEDDIKLADIHEGLDSTLIITNNMLGSKINVVKNYGELPKIECYPGKLNQVFLNIISNGIYAIKARHGDENTGQLTITTSCTPEYVRISLKDNGTGMSDATKRKLFEPFFTTKPVGEGTGLGLSIVYNTINKHNGSIDVHTEQNAGTEFIILLPVRQPNN